MAKLTAKGNRVKPGISHRKEIALPPKKWTQADSGKQVSLNTQKQRLKLSLE